MITVEQLKNLGFIKVNCVSEMYEIEVEDEFIKYFNIHIDKGRTIASTDTYGREIFVREVKDVDDLKSLFSVMTTKTLTESQATQDDRI